jgi:hypothetical protein
VRLRAFVGPLVVTAVAGLGALAVAQGASPAGGIPSCAAGASSGARPHPDCLVRPWAGSGAAQVTGSAKLTHFARGRKVPGGYAYNFTIVVSYANPFPVCVNSAPIPCQQEAPVIDYIGNYVKGAATLGADGVGVDLTPCPAAGPKCTLHYWVLSSEVNGRVALLYSLNVVDLTTDPTNDLGQSGFEFPIVIDVPKPSAKS